MTRLLTFYAFMTWLYAVPLEGSLLPPSVSSHHILVFLGAHVGGFFFLWRFRRQGPLSEPMVRASFALLSLLTLLLYLMPENSLWIFGVMGLVGAPSVVTALHSMKEGGDSLVRVCGALFAANLTSFLLVHLSAVPLGFRAGAVMLLLLLLAFLSHGVCNSGTPQADDAFASIPLPFFGLFFSLFYIAGGLLHGQLAPMLENVDMPQRIYTLSYLFMLPLGAILFRNSRDAALGGAMVLGVGGYTLLAYGGVIPLVVGMILSQASFGISDMVVIGMTQMMGRKFHETALIMGCMCLGILSGGVIVTQAGGELYIAAGVVNVLIVVALVLYLQMRLRHASPHPDGAVNTATGFTEHPDLLCLSEMEKQVLVVVMEGATYKVAAEELGISESTVKTYMQRMFQKFDCGNRRALLRHMERLKQGWEEGESFLSENQETG